ncbi:signal transduction histidine kinase : Histidine kinase OS=Singulisphaera acidiphila (strain ATCC BAA-1392 / DSM 18658 / VKM B-2454 / MOB10) GN=Sinac_0425 PE=4 SV=1: HAMP: HisKA: HATPase_c [Gemmata massiliana]|uniref:histidine kinase n=1 Tax=Gemmata massiliana TaxID=1210884 RepID=A0A6P2D597_9BACT|nr:ATP-binding protein [Gemmata massiliana]VTR95264.1 signal transduction histidine kinase : Histidine kinase OS=Singulisphaera acidiphila (strain ATCC BAA-1392 / DSM 18658 / VKM B-2454 / MOB10) GN=Sinac_0425 PE=4 SV=1: HAMP: HisKA: HATPase_c [Gemmata massiliana]
MTLTTRLSLFFLAALAAVLVAFSAALYVLAHRHLTRQLDDRLESTSRALASAAEIKPDGVEWEPEARPFPFTSSPFGDELRWSVAAEGGSIVDQSTQDDARELLAEADAGFRTGHRNPRRLERAGRAWQATRIRLAPEPTSRPVPLKHGKFSALVVTVAVPLDPVHSTLRTLAATLTGLTLAVLGVALVTSRAVCRRALAPVTRMAEAAHAMGTDLAERLPDARSTDELANLTGAFNGLLDRLAEAFERERRFAGEASHQLRTPLTALIGQIEVALRRDRTPEEYHRVLGSVLDQAGRLRRVIEALLFLARSEADARLPGVERIDLTAWTDSRLKERAESSRSADLIFAPTAGEIPVAIHPDLFGELFDAVLDNALKYSAPGTTVTVRTGRDAKGARVEIEDHGCGIAPNEVPHLFRPFFRSEIARRRGIPGVGLGLAVAARIASALGGSIDVQSEFGHGCRVAIRLPHSPIHIMTENEVSTGEAR